MMDFSSPLSSSVQRRQNGYNVQDQNEMVSQLQGANFDLKMEVHGLKDELSRLRKQNPGDESGDLERNKALLMKARHAIGKLQAERDRLVAQLKSSSDNGMSTADTIALKSRLERSDDRVGELESALGEANAMIDSLRRDVSVQEREKSRVAEDTHTDHWSQSIHQVNVQSLEHEVSVKQREVDELGKELSDLQAQFLQRHAELQHAHQETRNVQHARGELEAMLNADREGHSRQLTEMENIMAMLRQQLSDNDAQHHQQTTQLENRIIGTREEASKQAEELTKVQGELQGVKGEMLKRVKQVEQYMAEEELSQSRQDQVSQELQNCYHQIDEAASKLEALKGDLTQNGEECLQQKRLTEVEKEKVSALETAMREVETTLESEKNELHIEIARLQEKLNAELMQKAQQAVQEAKLMEQLKELGEVRASLTLEQGRTHDLEMQLQAQTQAMQAQVKASEQQILVLKTHTLDAANEFESRFLKAATEHQERAQEAAATQEELSATISQLEADMAKAREESERKLLAKEMEAQELKLKLDETETALVSLQAIKVSLEKTLEEKTSALEGSLANAAQMEHLLRDRAEAASSAALNAEYIVSECDNLRQHHANAFGVLQERHERMLASGRESRLNLNGDLAIELFEVVNCEAMMQARSDELMKKMADMESDLKQELAARVMQFEKDIDLVRGAGEEAKAHAEDLQNKNQRNEVNIAQFESWLESMTGRRLDTHEAQEQVRLRCEQHQQLLIEIGELLRSFLFDFPAPGAVDIPGLKIPSATELWSSDEFTSLREGLVVSLRCVLNMFHAVEERWKRQYADLHQVVDIKTEELHRLEAAITGLRRAQSPLKIVPNPAISPRGGVDLHSELKAAKREEDRKEMEKRDAEQMDMLRQTSIEASITTLTDQIHGLKSELNKERRTNVGDSNTTQESQEHVNRLADNYRVLLFEFAEIWLSLEKVAKDLLSKDKQNEVLQAELKRLRGAGSHTQSAQHVRRLDPDPSVGSRMFDYIDSNRDGSIDRHEFASALQEGGRLLQGMQMGTFGSLKETTDTFKATGQNLQRLRQECAEYREELARLG